MYVLYFPLRLNNINKLDVAFRLADKIMLNDDDNTN